MYISARVDLYTVAEELAANASDMAEFLASVAAHHNHDFPEDFLGELAKELDEESLTFWGKTFDLMQVKSMEASND